VLCETELFYHNWDIECPDQTQGDWPRMSACKKQGASLNEE